MQRLIDTKSLAEWIGEFGRVITNNKDVLSELDSASGDADHGSNMERGMVALPAVLDGITDATKPGALLKDVGMTIVAKVGGSSGALYGTVFLRMAMAAGDTAAFDALGFAKALRAALNGIVERGNVKSGDKTMYDALAPAVDALDAELARGMTLGNALRTATEAAEAGRDATKLMLARKGKSSYLAEKSLGSQDPGATSMAMLIGAAAATLGRS